MHMRYLKDGVPRQDKTRQAPPELLMIMGDSDHFPSIGSSACLFPTSHKTHCFFFLLYLLF